MGGSVFLLDKKRLEGKAERAIVKVESLWTLSRSDLGARLIAPEVLRVLKVVEARGRLQTAKRLRARRFVFPSNRSRQRCMSESTTNAALRRLVLQGRNDRARLRSAASSVLNECGLWHADAVERQLAHVDNDSVRRAYARADVWDERVRMMTWWALRCRELQAGAIVVSLRE